MNWREVGTWLTVIGVVLLLIDALVLMASGEQATADVNYVFLGACVIYVIFASFNSPRGQS